MSDEIREQEWKTIWENQEFQPSAKGWEKMARALSGEEQASATVVPAWWSWRRYGKAAAAAVLLGLGTWSVWQFNRQPQPGKDVVSEQVAKPDANNNVAPIVDEQQPEAGSAPVLVKEKEQRTGTGLSPAKESRNTILPEWTPPLPEHRPVEDPTTIIAQKGNDSLPLPVKEIYTPEAPRKQDAFVKNNEQKAPGFEPIENQPGMPALPRVDNRPMSVALAANIGKPNLGNIQYNVGVVLHKEWNDAFFAEASVSMAATDVRFAENTRYGISYKSGDIVNSEGFNSALANTIGETETVYGNNILGVGVAPMVGYKITKQVSLSVGVDVYRNINTGLNLYYNNDIRQKKIKDMDMVKNVSQWDSGVKGQLGIRMNKALSILAQYRQGMTNYISTEQKTYKNAFFNIGLMYRFQP